MPNEPTTDLAPAGDSYGRCGVRQNFTIDGDRSTWRCLGSFAHNKGHVFAPETHDALKHVAVRS
jgi:hypothetical protein